MSDISAALTEAIEHAKHGERSDDISAEAYAFVIKYLEHGRDLLGNGEVLSAKKAAEITYGKLEGEYAKNAN